MASFKNNVFYDSSSPGSGKRIGNVKNDVIYDGTSPGSGRKVGNVKDYRVKGGESLRDDLVVATYHFLIKRIF